MSDIGRERFEELKAYVDGLPEAQFKAQASKGQASEQAVFDLINNGDALGLYCSIKQDPSLLARQNASGMTPLHWCSVDKSGLIGEILTSEVSAAPWTRDRFGCLPLDIARETGNHKIGDKLERLTYPQLFKEEKDGPIGPDLVNAYNEKRKELGNPDTAPAFNREFNTKNMMPDRSRSTDKDFER